MRATLLVATFLAAAAGCVGASGGQTPPGAGDRSGAAAEGYPSLRSVPRGADANTDPAYWARAEAELKAAGEAMRAHPRAQALVAPDPADFLEQARRDLEESRGAHQPN